MAGNTVYMQPGSKYIDIHDNEVVNLNIDKGTVEMDDGRCQMDDVEESAATEEEGREKAAVLTENGEFMRILERAVAAGFCSKDGWQYRWKVKVEAAYFASLANERFGLSKRKMNGKKPAVSWIPFQALFGLKELRTAFNDYKQCKTALVREGEIDELFR